MRKGSILGLVAPPCLGALAYNNKTGNINPKHAISTPAGQVYDEDLARKALDLPPLTAPAARRAEAEAGAS